MQTNSLDTPFGVNQAERLEVSLEAVESHLGALGTALRDRDLAGVENHAADLHRALAAAMHRFTQASRQVTGTPPALRQRFAMVSGQIAAQRESLARATAALDRAIEVLLPQAPIAAYGRPGQAERPPAKGALHA